jgi:hypothetical protein
MMALCYDPSFRNSAEAPPTRAVADCLAGVSAEMFTPPVSAFEPGDSRRFSRLSRWSFLRQKV